MEQDEKLPTPADDRTISSSPTTLSEASEPHAASLDRLMKEYGPLIHLVEMFLGVVPSCDVILAIWPTGFRTYNALIPGALNLPEFLWSGRKSIVGLCMYYASKAARCQYCTAHCCSFALRRGASEEAILGSNQEDYSEKEKSAIRVATALGSVPTRMTPELRREFEQHYGPSDAEKIVAPIALMGFLNKFMDATGTELENEVIGDVGGILAQTGWQPGAHVRGGSYTAPPSSNNNVPKDGIHTYLCALRYGPGATRLEHQWTRGVPGSKHGVAKFLTEHVGHDFPVLKEIRSNRWRRILATVLRDNLDPQTTSIGLKTKFLAAVLMASALYSPHLQGCWKALIARRQQSISIETVQHLEKFGMEPQPVEFQEAIEALQRYPGVDQKDAYALLLAKAASTSPASVTSAHVALADEHLAPEDIVELVVWLSVLQLLHRLDAYYMD